MKRRGFSLIEVTMAVALVVVLSSIAVLNFTRGRNKAGAQGLAYVLKEELGRVRQEAIARRRPTALVLPTDGGRYSATRSFYVLDGEAEPRIVRSRNFATEFAGAEIFMGRWPLIAGSFTPTPPVLPGSKWEGFSVDNWLPAASPAHSDYCFVFLPDGTVRTNGLLSFDDRYHLVVAAGTSYSPTASNATLQGAGESYTISISPVGGISQSSGVLGATSSLVASGTRTTPMTHFARNPIQVTPVNPSPLAGNPAIYPEPTLPVDTSLPEEERVDAVITREQYVSLEMRARSDSGEQLFCQWKVTQTHPPGGTKVGAFSMQSESTGGAGAGGRMEWDQSLSGGQGAWKAIWQWRPPVDAVPSERYRLACEVQNIKTGEKTVEIKRFEIKPPGKVLFETDRNGAPEIFTMDESGARERPYLPLGKNPSATLDGSRICYVKKSDNNLYLYFPMDPGNEIQLTTSGGCSFPSISPNGNFVAYFHNNDIRIIKTAPGATAVAIESGVLSRFPNPKRRQTVRLGWSNDGLDLYYPGGSEGKNLMRQRIGVAGSGQPTLVGAAASAGTGAGLISSVTGGVNGIVHYTDDYSTYDPWIRRTDTGVRQYLSVNFEDASVERCPRGENQFMITRASVVPGDDSTIGERQLHIVTYTGPDTAAVGPALTSAGSNTRPVWTQ